MAVSTFVRLLTGVVLFVFLARDWGSEVFGVFMYWMTVMTLFGLLADFGYGQSVLRAVGKDPDRARQIMGVAWSAKLALSLISVIGLFVFLLLLQVDPEIMVLASLLLVSIIINSFAEFTNCGFRAMGRYHDETRVVIFSNIAHFSIIGLGLLSGADLLGIGFLFAVSRSVYLWLSLRRFRIIAGGSMDWCSSPSLILSSVRKCLPFGTDCFLTTFAMQVDTLIVNFFFGAVGVGVYEAGKRIVGGAATLAMVLGNVFLPKIARFATNGAQLKILASSLALQMVSVGVFWAVLFTLGGDYLIQFLYGAGYIELEVIFPWFGLFLLVRFIAASQGVLLTGTGQQAIRVYANLLSLGLLALFSYILLPSVGLVGVVWASIASATGLLILYVLRLKFTGVPTGFSRPVIVALLLFVAIDLGIICTFS